MCFYNAKHRLEARWPSDKAFTIFYARVNSSFVQLFTRTKVSPSFIRSGFFPALSAFVVLFIFSPRKIFNPLFHQSNYTLDTFNARTWAKIRKFVDSAALQTVSFEKHRNYCTVVYLPAPILYSSDNRSAVRTTVRRSEIRSVPLKSSFLCCHRLARWPLPRSHNHRILLFQCTL